MSTHMLLQLSVFYHHHEELCLSDWFASRHTLCLQEWFVEVNQRVLKQRIMKGKVAKCACLRRCVQVVKSQPYQGSFQSTHFKRQTNIWLWIYTLNGTVWYLFCLVWSRISCFRDKNVICHRCVQVIKSQPYQGSLQNTHSKTNIRLRTYTLNGTIWYLFCLVWSSISCFRDENVSHIQVTDVYKW